MGHLGLTPQSAGAKGGFRLQGKGALQAKQIFDDAMALEQAGVFAILLELVPSIKQQSMLYFLLPVEK